MAVERTPNNEAFVTALMRHDVGSVADAYAPDARLIGPVIGLVDGREQIAAFWRAGIELGIRRASFVPHTVAQDEACAYEVGRYTLLMADSDGAVLGERSDRGFYALVHRRASDGSWRFALHILDPDEPSSP